MSGYQFKSEPADEITSGCADFHYIQKLTGSIVCVFALVQNTVVGTIAPDWLQWTFFNRYQIGVLDSSNNIMRQKELINPEKMCSISMPIHLFLTSIQGESLFTK